MVTLNSYTAVDKDTVQALQSLSERLPQSAAQGSLVFCFYGCVHDDTAIHAFLCERFPNSAKIGGTSCGGVMSQEGVLAPESIGLLVVDDSDGEYGVAGAPLGADAASTAEALLHEALTNAGCPGQLPELIWIYQTPGREEAVIEGLRRVVGETCPIIGGSSADNDVSGQWRQLAPSGPITDGLVVAVLFPSGGIGYAFQGGYEPTGTHGVVTRVAFDQTGDTGVVTKSYGRRILEIDGRPAAEVYDRWIGGSLSDRLDTQGSILAETTMTPLAIDAGAAEGVDHFLLIHPDAIVEDRGLSTFADIQEGTRVHSMRGDRQLLVERAGRVARSAAARLDLERRTVAGALVIYCGGCRLAVGDRINDVPQEIAAHLSGQPFLGCFTFGEQGRLLERNVHGNLMISAITFGR